MPSFFRRKNIPDILLTVAAVVALIVILTRYGMPFRMDDVLYMQWADHHSLLDALSPNSGEIFLSFRPVIAIVFWLLTHIVGTEHYWVWHFVLVGSFFAAIAFTGLTARFISEKKSALEISAIWYWLAFLPILNILFWFSDMTYALEMMFCAMAWYYGLRAIEEPKLSTWVIANLVGILAVLTKEPSVLLIHGVWIGAIFLRWKKFKRGIKKLTKNGRITWTTTYVIFILISVNQFFLSNAASTRFFHFTAVPHDEMMFFLKDRIRYYTETLCQFPFLLYMLAAVFGIITANTAKLPKRRLVYCCIFLFVGIILWVVSKPVLILFFLVTFFLFPLQGSNRATRMSFLSLFALIAMINIGFLLITIMLVKTQIAELTFLFSVIGGAGVSIIFYEINTFLVSTPNKLLRIGIVSGTIGIAVIIFFALLPKLRAKEQLLLDVRTSRIHANDAIKSMARLLPTDAIVAVTGPALYGMSSENEITSMDDTYKLYAQHTFPQGFVRAYFQTLGRHDLHLAYLEDSTILRQELDSSRSAGNEYLFLQTSMDVDRFHGLIDGAHQIAPTDSLVMRFQDGGFPCEIWKLGK
ncbi:MAG TPA: hypothetical protein VEW28_07340 [Candidatus Kapabacteria bacterium]|nr:hypothetical protein [Candidatus Kapabacteria bacterium]